MRAALAVHRVTGHRWETLERIVQLIRDASDRGADLVMFSETAVTGFKATDQPEQDILLGEPVPGPTTDMITSAAHDRNIWVALGLYEREDAVLYDSALLISPEGTLTLKHRRSDRRWHFRDADPSTYGSGMGLNVAETPWGSVALLLCGELMSRTHIEAVRQLAPNYLLVPFARGYDEDAHTDDSWYQQNLPSYAAQAREAGAITLMTNHLDADGPCCFGGALAFNREGDLVATKLLHEEGLLLVDV